ncbi:MAG: T9SS type A sorting domain-containing protein [Fidelibacterota bacterium]
MKIKFTLFFILIVSALIATAFGADKKDYYGMTKLEYYNKVLAPERGLKPLIFEKQSRFEDRKRSVLDVGNLIIRISNAATLGYDRWGLNHEFPAGSGITYYWTLAPMIGGKKRVNGELVRSVAIGTRGAARDAEEEFEPLPGYDAGVVEVEKNIGIAFSDKPESWPSVWPANPYVDPWTGLSFNIEKPKDKDHPEGSGLDFPGVFDGKVVATREAYFVVTDNDPDEGNLGIPATGVTKGVGPLDIRVDMWALQYSDVLNEDFVIFKEVITNVGSDTIFDVYIGLHGDPDTPEQGAQEWTDDFAVFYPPGDDRVDSLLWNLMVVWDADDRSEGFLESGVGWIGLKVLETPEDPDNPGHEKGVTTFDSFEYSAAPQGDNAAYEQMAQGIEPPHNITPHPTDQTKTPMSYGPDITIVIASGPFTLPPGESLPMTFASILGVDRSDVLNNSSLVQILYNNDYKASEPPPEPIVHAVASDKKVTLYWDAYPSEYGVDRLTGNNRFQGYRIYKSTDRGKTWGKPITDVNGVVRGYVPIAIFDKKDGIKGVNPYNPYLDQGSDSGLQHSFVDYDVINGFEYWYAVCAFDSEDEFKINPEDPTGTPVPPMENPRRKDASVPGDNTVAVIPRAEVAGYNPGTAAIEHSEGISTATLEAVIYDFNAMVDNSYTITIDDSTYSYKTLSVYDSKLDEWIIVEDENLHGEDFIPSFDGIRLFVTDEEEIAFDEEHSYWYNENTQDTSKVDYKIEAGVVKPIAADYEIRFTDRGDTSKFRKIQVPFEIWNVTADERLDFILQNSATDTTSELKSRWSSGDHMTVMENNVWTWAFTLTSPYETIIDTIETADTTIYDTSYVDVGIHPQTGDIAKIFTKKPLTSKDVYILKTRPSNTIGASKDDLQAIRVVPNPYTVTSFYETSVEVKQIQFTHLPEKATIRIFNIAGDLIKTIEHNNGTSIEFWDLRTYNDQEISFGIYIYHVEAPGIGDKMGKFAIIK